MQPVSLGLDEKETRFIHTTIDFVVTSAIILSNHACLGCWAAIVLL